MSFTYLIGGVLVPPSSLILLGLLGVGLRRRRPAIGNALTGFSLLISLANILGYGVYAVLLARLIDGKLQGGAHPKEE